MSSLLLQDSNLSPDKCSVVLSTIRFNVNLILLGKIYSQNKLKSETYFC